MRMNPFHSASSNVRYARQLDVVSSQFHQISPGAELLDSQCTEKKMEFEVHERMRVNTQNAKSVFSKIPNQKRKRSCPSKNSDKFGMSSSKAISGKACDSLSESTCRIGNLHSRNSMRGSLAKADTIFSFLLCSTCFLDSEILSCNSPETIRAETLRRMELMILDILSQICAAFHPSPSTECVGSHQRTAPVTDCAASFLSGRLREWHRSLVCLPLIYRNVKCNVLVTQRDLFYHLVRHIPDQRMSDACIKRLGKILKVPRSALHVVAGQRGSVGGCISQVFLDEDGCWEGIFSAKQHARHADIPIPVEESALRVLPWNYHLQRDVALSPRWRKRKFEPKSIYPTSPMKNISPVSLIERNSLRVSPPLFYLSPATRAVIVIEKYAVYHRLMQERCSELFPCILLTSHGFPTYSARQLLSSIAVSIREIGLSDVGSFATETCLTHPRPLLLALADFNPSGVSIIHQYKLGGRNDSCGRGGKEMEECRVPDLRWLGVRSSHVLVETTAESGLANVAGTTAEPLALPLPNSSASIRLPSSVTQVGVEGSYFSVFPYTCFTSRDDALMRHLLEDVDTLQATYEEMLQEYTAEELRKSHEAKGSRVATQLLGSPIEDGSKQREKWNLMNSTLLSMQSASTKLTQDEDMQTSKNIFNGGNYSSALRNGRRTVDQWKSLALDLATCSCYQSLSSNTSRYALLSGASVAMPKLLQSWRNELLVMQKARIKIEIDMLVDQPFFGVGCDAPVKPCTFPDAFASIENHLHLQPYPISSMSPPFDEPPVAAVAGTRGKKVEERYDRELAVLPLQHDSLLSSSNVLCATATIPPCQGNNASMVVVSSVESRVESKRPLSEWLYQRIILQDYL